MEDEEKSISQDIITEEIISELEDDRDEQSKKNKKLKKKVNKRNIVIGILIIIK